MLSFKTLGYSYFSFELFKEIDGTNIDSLILGVKETEILLMESVSQEHKDKNQVGLIPGSSGITHP